MPREEEREHDQDDRKPHPRGKPPPRHRAQPAAPLGDGLEEPDERDLPVELGVADRYRGLVGEELGGLTAPGTEEAGLARVHVESPKAPFLVLERDEAERAGAGTVEVGAERRPVPRLGRRYRRRTKRWRKQARR